MPAFVNLDALIPREDFAVESDGDFDRIERIGVRDLEKSFFLTALRKPDFQRETASWTPEAVLDLVRSFLDGDLIPAVILWQSGKHVFVIDGAHRLSAVIAWVANDYGDGALSQRLSKGNIPEPQRAVAARTRALINGKLGSYADHNAAIEFPEKATEEIRANVQRLASRSIPVQWVPGNDVKKAEKSFFTINQAGTPINKVETTILKARTSANALAARAIMRGGSGHKYWKGFPEAVVEEIETIAAEIHSIMYDPGLALPIKTLDIPVAGQSYGAHSLPLAFDLVNLANNQKLMEATKSGRGKGNATVVYSADDKSGASTLEYLKRTLKVVRRISGNDAGSLGLHPAVYFYSPSGNFQPSAFLGGIMLIQSLESNNGFARFTDVRGELETILIENKHFIGMTTHKLGSGHRSSPSVRALLEKLITELALKSPADAVDALLRDANFSFLAVPKAQDEESSVGKKRVMRSAAFLAKALETPMRCPICNGLMHRNSMSGDHRQRKADGGPDTIENLQLTHFYCNTVHKERRVAAAKKAAG